MLATNKRNGAIAATPVATLTNLEVGVVLRCGEFALGLDLCAVVARQGAYHAIEGACAEVFVDLGNLLAQLVGITLREATYNEELLDKPCALCLHAVEYGVDALLLGIADKSTGVYHDHLGSIVAIEENLVARHPHGY